MEEAIRIREWYFNVSYLELRSTSLAAKFRGQRFNCFQLSYWKVTCITAFSANQTLMHGRWFSCAYCLFGRHQQGDFRIAISFLHSLVLAIIKWFLLVSWFYLFICLSLILLLFLEADCSPANAFILGDAWHRALAIAVAKCKLSELSDHKGFNYWNLFVGLDKKSALMKDGPDSTMSRDLGYR